MSDRPLEGRVALVTGASRNIGRGIAIELAASGAAVYATGRTTGDPSGTGDGLDATVSQAKELGGQCVGLRCDHANDDEVADVFERIASDHGQLDILVNNASPDFSSMVGRPFWELPFDAMSVCLDIGPRSNFVATALAARMMIPKASGLIVNISSHGARRHLLSVPYGVGKAGIDKLTADTALELAGQGVAVISLWPGLVKTERIMSQAVAGEDGRLLMAGLDLSIGESPRFPGRAIAALFTDPKVLERSGQALRTQQVAGDYGFTDVDGNVPPDLTNLAEYLGGADKIPPFWRGVERFPGAVGAEDEALT